jgi:phage tail sheath protein FI
VWGARTLSSESAWKYINVKRLFIYVEASIDNGTQWVVFEPNDQSLWARIRQTITDFLTTTWRSGALQGATAAEAFFVKCDMTTMTQDDIDNGRLICLIGIAPVKPAEFVIFRIQQFTQAIAS